MPNDAGVELLDGRSEAGHVGAATTLSALAAMGCLIAATRLLSLEDAHLRRAGWGWFAEAGICAAVLGALRLRRRWSAGQAEAAALLVAGATLAAQVNADWSSALSSARFTPFEGFKILALAVATVMPFRPAFAYGLIGACAAIPLLVYGAMSAPMRAELPVEAPWTTMIYPVIAAGILVYRLQALRMEREMVRARARREALERLAKTSLAYRDLANSPLQAIELLRAELQREHPESKVLLERLRRNLGRLRAMGEMLSETEHQVTWTSKEEAFDAGQVIAEYQRAAGT